MKTVRRKLHSNSGASLMVALLYFIVCAVVGSVIIAAASTSMGRMKNLRQSDKEREMLESATRLVVDGLTRNGELFSADDEVPVTSSDDASLKQTGVSKTVRVSGGTLTSEAEYTYFTTGDRKFIWGPDKTFSVNASAFEGVGTLQSNKTWKWETWPMAPAGSRWPKTKAPREVSDETASLYQTAVQNALKDQATLEQYRNARADALIAYYWGSGPDDTLTSATSSRYLLVGWKDSSVPSNQSWLFYPKKNGENLAEAAAKNDPLRNILHKQSFTLTAGDKTDEKDLVKVDLYMDAFMNLEVQIYPASKDYYERPNGPEEDSEIVKFENAPMRYLIRIPAKTGEVRYKQSESNASLNSKRYVATWKITKHKMVEESDETGNVITKETTEVVEEGTNQIIDQKKYDEIQDYAKDHAELNVWYDIDFDSTEILQVKVTRDLILSDFGWDTAQMQMFTGASVEAAGYEKGEYLTERAD